MITEDYVSFEVAKLLKEKGFNEPLRLVIRSNGVIEDIGLAETNKNLLWTDKCCSCVSHQMAMKWLREVHNLHIEIYRTACGYQYIVSNIPYGTDLYASQYEGDDEDSGQFTTNEKAVEAALKYCLTKIL